MKYRITIDIDVEPTDPEEYLDWLDGYADILSREVEDYSAEYTDGDTDANQLSKNYKPFKEERTNEFQAQMVVELIGKIVIVTLGIASVVGMLLLLAGACDIIADGLRETREEDFTDDSSYNSDN